ncbi:MAG: hypothetical protein A2474_08345 [Elusimicrobia bacterium RIFOXYC2_FULL_34_12]|nr:MAG: hypothetical protein A2474_08345 [Elusimicrobia bacterium RIFOXYC2_FULL_34_12]OGS39675.1 MAG: hypothetical protein A2551_07490 [Elusimicrobia bacterium RIFOXYD2_FULL_34_30]HAM38607.1 Rrf2 family transcriptional regulator [Elusimicrobiota bacterium]
MKFFKKNTDYAVRAIMYLAKNRGKYISSTEISEKEDISLYFIRRILQVLTNKGIISSREGVSGGVKLSIDAKNINVTKLMKIFQGKIELSDCKLKQDPCPKRSQCVIRKRIKNIEDKVITEFNNITVERLLKDLEVARWR